MIVLVIAVVALCMRMAEAEELLQLPAGATGSLQDWEEIYRPSILKRMQEVMGRVPEEHRLRPLNVRVIEEVDCGEYVRRFLTYDSEPNSIVPAYLLIPKSVLSGRAQTHGVLCLHQTHSAGQEVVVGLGESPNDEYGVELVKRGYVCIAPPYPLLANYAPNLKGLGYESGTMKAILDNIRALDLLESLPYIKRGAFASIGHSLGGHNGLFTAAFDSRVKVVITSCGFDSFRDYKGGDIRGWTSERYMPRLLHYYPSNLPFDFHEVLAAISPRRIFINAPIGDSNFKWGSVDEVVQTALPIYQLYRAESNIVVAHPEVGHLFPIEMRQRAYEMIERELPPLQH